MILIYFKFCRIFVNIYTYQTTVLVDQWINFIIIATYLFTKKLIFFTLSFLRVNYSLVDYLLHLFQFPSILIPLSYQVQFLRPQQFRPPIKFLKEFPYLQDKMVLEYVYHYKILIDPHIWLQVSKQLYALPIRMFSLV